MKKIWIVTMWQDDEYGSGHSYIWKICFTEEKAREYANQHPDRTDVEECDIDE